MKTKYILAAGILLTIALHAKADTFGRGANIFTINFVNIGNAGNADDAGAGGGIFFSPYGGVPYAYRMGTNEISRDVITKWAATGLGRNLGGGTVDRQPAGGDDLMV